MSRGKKNKTHEMPQDECPLCLYAMDAASGVRPVRSGGKAPSPGDLSICLKGGGILAWDENMKLWPASEEQIKDMDERDRPLVEASRAYIAQRGPIRR